MRASYLLSFAICARHGPGTEGRKIMKFRTRSKRQGLAAIALAATLSVVGAACGTGSQPSPSQPGQLSSAELATLSTVVNQAKGIPPFVAPGPSFNATAASGKTVVAVPLSSQIPYCDGIVKAMQVLGTSIGVKVTNYTSSGAPADWQAAAILAASQRAGAFTTICGIDPASLAPQLANLKAQNIPSVALLGDVSLSVPSTVTAGASIQLNKAADILVDAAIVDNGGKPFHTLILTNYDIYGAHAPTDEAAAHLTSVCGSNCPSTVMSIPHSDWSSAIGSTVSALLTRDPQITAIIALYDGMVAGFVPAVKLAQRPGLKVYTYGASAGVVDLIPSTNGIVAANIGASTDWTAYSQMDQVLRLLTGLPPAPYADEYPPLRLWDSTNVSEFHGTNPYGTAYVSGFNTLWGIK